MTCKFWKTGEPGRRSPRLGSLAIAALAFAVAAATPTSAKADTITYSLATGNSAISPTYPGPYGTVTVNRTSTTTAIITFTASNNGSQYFLFGDGGTVGVNVNGTFTVGTISGAGGLGGPTTLSSGGAGNEDGFGSFNFTANNGKGAADAVQTVDFTLTLTSGTWAKASDVLTANASGQFVAAHVFVYSASNYPLDALATGFATDGGNNTTEEVPEPASIAMVGIGLLGMAGYRWRRRRLTSSAA